MCYVWFNIERVTGKTRICYSGDVCKLVEPKAFLVFMEIYSNRLAPGNLPEKRVLKLVEPFFHHCRAKKN